MVDCAAAKLNGLIIGEIPFVPIVKDTVGVQAARANRENFARCALSIAVYVIEARALRVPPGNHCPHRQAHPAVRKHVVGQQLRGGAHADAPLIVELKQAALHAEVALPEGAVSSASGHRAEKEWVDFDHLLYCLRRDIGSHGSPGINSNDHSALKDEPQGRRSVVWLHVLHHLTLEAIEILNLRKRKGGLGNAVQAQAEASSLSRGCLGSDGRHGSIQNRVVEPHGWKLARQALPSSTSPKTRSFEIEGWKVL
mmetsp:Transcript_3629/g.10457  ORF Transcript_3629/g.10457 Transcript_3629/m.10457 type:complete len:254 (+) Transcript_3629:286-1047(+)